MALVFDASYYLSQNPDVLAAAAAGLTTAEAHFANFGWKELRNPNAVFDTSDYLTANADVLAAQINPLAHFLAFGAAEGRTPSVAYATIAANFDSANYLSANPDVQTAVTAGTFTSAYQHWVLYGQYETARPVAQLTDGTLVSTLVSGGTTSTNGSTFTLTTSIDNLTGTSNDDTFIGDNTGSSNTTSSGDQLSGGAGTDSLTVYIPAATNIGAVTLPTLTSIENVTVIGGDFLTTSSVSYSSLTGVNNVTLKDVSTLANTETFTITTGTSQTLGLNNVNVATGGAATLSLSGGSALTLSGVGSDTTNNGALTVDYSGSQTSATIATTGASSTVTLADTGTQLTSLTITGDQALSLTESLGGITTINASAATGNVSVNAGGIAAAALSAAFAFTGGSGSDTLTLATDGIGKLTAGTQLAFGAGTGDKLVIADTAITSAEYGKINAATGLETLGLTAAVAVDASQLTSVKSFAFDANAIQSISNLKTGSSVAITAAHAANATFNTAVGVNDLALTIGTSTSTGFTVGGDLTIGATTVSLVSNGKSGTNTITEISNADNSVYTITGTAALTISDTAATTVGSKYDASAMTKAVSIAGNDTAFANGSSLGDILIGGSAADTLNSSINGATMTGNAGADTFNVSRAVGTTDGATLATITDFTAGDKMVLMANNGTAAYSTTKVDVSAAASLSAAIALAASGDGSVTSTVKWFQYSNATYVVQDNTAGAFAATDQVVKLVGTLDLSTSTFDDATATLTFA